jgi:hypothetical protein
MFNSKGKKTNNIPNISIKADTILGDKKISKALSSARVIGKQPNHSNRSQSTALLNMINNINSVVSPRNSIHNFLKKTLNDYPAVLNTMNSNDSSQRLYTLPNKNISRDGPILTEQSITNSMFANDLKVPQKIKDKVNNLRLYSKPKADFSKGYGKVAVGPKKLNKTNFSIKTLELKTSFQYKNGEGNFAVISKPAKSTQSQANLEKVISTRSKDFRNTFNINKEKNSQLALLKKQKENTKHVDYKKACETELFRSIEVEKNVEVSEEHNNVSDDALSAGEVQDIIKAFKFSDSEYKEGSLFGNKKESYFNTNLRHKYVNFLFTSVLQDR